ncbi:MAG: 3-isopropylmalate dehydratase small subunit [Candidatus Hydrothermarchaeaceae archaeon]
MILKGRAWKFGDGISTDHIAPGRYFHLRTNLPELAEHVLEDADQEFAKKVKKGDFIVADKNFGMGSSREHAPRIIKIKGVSAVLAKSFARIFYRNAINIGLPAIQLDTSGVDEGDELEIDLEAGVVLNKTRDSKLSFNPLPDVMVKLLEDGGLVEHVKKHGGFKLK